MTWHQWHAEYPTDNRIGPVARRRPRRRPRRPMGTSRPGCRRAGAGRGWSRGRGGSPGHGTGPRRTDRRPLGPQPDLPAPRRSMPPWRSGWTARSRWSPGHREASAQPSPAGSPPAGRRSCSRRARSTRWRRRPPTSVGGGPDQAAEARDQAAEAAIRRGPIRPQAGRPGGEVAVFAANAGEPDQAQACVAATVERFGGSTSWSTTRPPTPISGRRWASTRPSSTRRWPSTGAVRWSGPRPRGRPPCREHGGVVLNISSIGGLSVEPHLSIYNGTKAALLHLTAPSPPRWRPACGSTLWRPAWSRPTWPGCCGSPRRSGSPPPTAGPAGRARRHRQGRAVPVLGRRLVDDRHHHGGRRRRPTPRLGAPQRRAGDVPGVGSTVIRRGVRGGTGDRDDE